MRYRKSLIIIFSVICITSANFAIAQPVKIDIDAAKDGPIYGDMEGLLRVKALESQLHAMEIREEHPRIFITKENLGEIREKIGSYNNYWQDILTKAENGNLINAAFCYAVLEDINEQGAKLALSIAKKGFFESLNKEQLEEKEIGLMGLAFDWIYNGMTAEERVLSVEKLSKLAKIDEKAERIRNGWKQSGETFHREEWMFNSYKAWPEIALARHNPNADFVYKFRWNYDWYWGDAARMYAYAADGTPFEGYYFGADGADWFLALKSATGVNLVDGEFGWCKNAAYHILYRLDLDRGREIFHHGAYKGAGGTISYKKGISAWKINKTFGATLPLALDNGYIKWLLNHEIEFSAWLLSFLSSRAEFKELENIAKLIFDKPGVREESLEKASYKDLPFSRFFSGGNEVYMRTGWLNKPACIGFRCSPAYTKNSHGDFDVNTFLIYRDGVLSSDSGVYDVYGGQKHYFNYQKNTIAHNNILVINPLMPDEPRKLGKIVDPGGVDLVKTKSFGSPRKSIEKNVFIHNPNANWADIAAFKTTPYYDYASGEAHKAYRERLERYYRSLVFIRKGNKGYLIVYDQMRLKKSIFGIGKHFYQIKWLLHLVTEPDVAGEKGKIEVPGRIEWYKGRFLKAKNVFNTSGLFLKMLKPDNYLIRKVGGEGYEFWVDGSKPKNYPIPQKEMERIESQTDGKWEEAGTWRIEIVPQDKKDIYDFINVFYIGDAEENFDSNIISFKEDKDAYKIEIKDDIVPSMVIFNKGEEPKGSIVINDNQGNLLAEDRFPEIKASRK